MAYGTGAFDRRGESLQRRSVTVGIWESRFQGILDLQAPLLLVFGDFVGSGTGLFRMGGGFEVVPVTVAEGIQDCVLLFEGVRDSVTLENRLPGALGLTRATVDALLTNPQFSYQSSC